MILLFPIQIAEQIDEKYDVKSFGNNEDVFNTRQRVFIRISDQSDLHHSIASLHQTQKTNDMYTKCTCNGKYEMCFQHNVVLYNVNAPFDCTGSVIL